MRCLEPRHDVGMEPRRILEAHEGAGARIHHRIDGAQDVDASAVGVAVDADLQRAVDAAFGDEAVSIDLAVEMFSRRGETAR